MTITLEPETERWIMEGARRAGTSPEHYLAERLREEHESLRALISDEEAQLLAKINEGFPDAFWTRYRQLIALREDHALTESERSELIDLSDQIEAKSAERFPYLLALAQRRATSLPVLIQQLGLRPTSVIS